MKLEDLFSELECGKYDLLIKYLKNKGDLTVLDDQDRSLLLVLLTNEDYPPDLAIKLLNADCAVEGTTYIGSSAEKDDLLIDNAYVLHAAYLNMMHPTNLHYELFHLLINHPKIKVNATVSYEAYPKANVLFSQYKHPNDITPQRSYLDGYILERATIYHVAALKNDDKFLHLLKISGKVRINATANLFRNKHQINSDLDPNTVLKEDVPVIVCRVPIPVYRVKEVTALHLAARAGLKNSCYWLIQHGGPIRKDSEGKLPIDYLKQTLKDRKYLENYKGAKFNFLEEDSDSEDDKNYEYVSEKTQIEQTNHPQMQEDKLVTQVVVEYRGLHFYPQFFSKADARQQRILQKLQKEGLAQVGMHSAASHQLAKCPYLTELPPITKTTKIKSLNTVLLAQDAKLEKKSLIVRNKMAALLQTGGVTQCLGVTRVNFDNRLYELAQRYVNSYKSLSDDLSKARYHRLDKRASAISSTKWNLLKSFGVSKLPLVSTADEARPALEYVTALVNYDKKGTFQPIDKAVTPLMPGYDQSGSLKRPYLGLVYISMHPTNTLNENSSLHVPTLFAAGKIDTSKGPGEHQHSGYVRARERIFLGYVSKEEVRYFSIVRLPSFDQTEYPDYYFEKYGLDEPQYNKFKAALSNYGTKDNNTGLLRNQKAFNRTIVHIMQFVIQHKQKELLLIAQTIAEKNNEEIIYLDADGEYQDSMPEITEFTSRRI